jgi:hypothetical protein
MALVVKPNHVDRTREIARQRKLRHWAAEYARTGATGSLRMADALREHAELVNEHWPTPADRHRDFEQHARMRAIYDRAAHGLERIARRPSSR